MKDSSTKSADFRRLLLTNQGTAKHELMGWLRAIHWYFCL